MLLNIGELAHVAAELIEGRLTEVMLSMWRP